MLVETVKTGMWGYLLGATVTGTSSFYCFYRSSELDTVAQNLRFLKSMSILKIFEQRNQLLHNEEAIQIIGKAKSPDRPIVCNDILDASGEPVKAVYRRIEYAEKLFKCRVASRAPASGVKVECNEYWGPTKTDLEICKDSSNHDEMFELEAIPNPSTSDVHHNDLQAPCLSVALRGLTEKNLLGCSKVMVDRYIPARTDKADLQQLKIQHKAYFITKALASQRHVSIDGDEVGPLVLGTRKTVSICECGDVLHAIGNLNIQEKDVCMLNPVVDRRNHTMLALDLQKQSESFKFWGMCLGVPSFLLFAIATSASVFGMSGYGGSGNGAPTVNRRSSEHHEVYSANNSTAAAGPD